MVMRNPTNATAWRALQRRGGRPLRPSLHPMAAYHLETYEKTVADLARLAQSPDGAREAARRLEGLNALHEVLMNGPESSLPVYPRLDFPVCKEPTVSVVVAAEGLLPNLYYGMAALLFARVQTPFEVILAVDEATPAGAALAELASGVRRVPVSAGAGPLAAWNAGAECARGEFIAFLPEGAEPAAGWLDELLGVFSGFDGVDGAASSVLDSEGAPIRSDAYAREPGRDHVRQVDHAPACGLMLSRRAWRALGGFDATCGSVDQAEVELGRRLREGGARLLHTPFSVIYRPDRPIDAADDPGPAKAEARRSLLMIDLQFPRAGNDAGSHAALQDIRLLQSLGFEIAYVPQTLEYLGFHTERLQRMGVEALHAPFVSSIEEILRARGREFEVIYITRYLAAQDHISAIREHAPQAKIVFCNADLHFLRESREAELLGSEKMQRRSEKTRKAELAVIAAADVTLSYSAVEHEEIARWLPDAKVAVAPWVAEVSSEVPGFDARRDIAFLGGFGHPPNQLAVEAFVADVMPLVRRSLPGVRLLIYGSRLPDKLAVLASDDVIIKGYVERARDAYDGCRVFVAPLLTGAGLKGKVIDALAFGAPSVLSPIAAEGAHIVPGREALIAETPDEWARAISRLYTDEASWSAMSQAARDCARRCYSFAVGQDLMRRALAQAGVDAPPESNVLVSRTDLTPR
jgi:glycosyltransferase involved in cell wall biosynthesis